MVPPLLNAAIEISPEAIAWAETIPTAIIVILLISLCIVSWLSNLIALPGNWLCVLLVAAYSWLGPSGGRAAISVQVVFSLFALALAGEIFEFAASGLGAKRAGASGKSTLYSIIGSMVGALAGAVIGVPIPVVGSMIAALLFGGIGAAVGAMYGEWNDGRRWKDNWSIGHATFWGRTFGTLGKFAFGFLIVSVIVVACVL